MFGAFFNSCSNDDNEFSIHSISSSNSNTSSSERLVSYDLFDEGFNSANLVIASTSIFVHGIFIVMINDLDEFDDLELVFKRVSSCWAVRDHSAHNLSNCLLPYISRSPIFNDDTGSPIDFIKSIIVKFVVVLGGKAYVLLSFTTGSLLLPLTSLLLSHTCSREVSQLLLVLSVLTCSCGCVWISAIVILIFFTWYSSLLCFRLGKVSVLCPSH